MLAILRKLITGTDRRTPAQVRGTQILAGIDQKIRASQGALRAARPVLAGLVMRERAGLLKVEALLVRMAAGQADADLPALQTAQADLARIAAQIGDISALVAQTEARMAVLQEAAIAARAVRPEHLAHCGQVWDVMGETGPEPSDRLMSRLRGFSAPVACCALFGGAAKLQPQIG